MDSRKFIRLAVIYLLWILSIIATANITKEAVRKDLTAYYENQISTYVKEHETTTQPTTKAKKVEPTTKKVSKPTTTVETTTKRQVVTTTKPVTTRPSTTKPATTKAATTKPTTTKPVAEPVSKGTSLEVPNVSRDFKSWTIYENCVNRKSTQWKILNGSNTWTDSNGFRRKGDDYMVAMGTYYVRNLGDRFRITTTNGSFTVTICDTKSNKHTDSKHQYSRSNQCIVEFYVANSLCKSVRHSGNCSSISALSGRITKIERL